MPSPPSAQESSDAALLTAAAAGDESAFVELATSAPGGAAPNAAIEAGLLIGEDGLARAIRFDGADTLPVYAASRSANGERR